MRGRKYQLHHHHRRHHRGVARWSQPVADPEDRASTRLPGLSCGVVSCDPTFSRSSRTPTCDGRTDGHRAVASNKCIAVRKVATWDRAGARVGECEACARCTVADPGFLQGGAAAGAFGVPQAPSCPLSLRPLRKFRGS